MSDLVSGRYQQQELWWRLLGMPSNASQPSQPIYSNLYYLGATAGITDAAQAATKKGWMVAIPVQEGAYITKVTVLPGATKGAAGKAVAAIYSGTNGATEATLIGNSAKTSGEAEIKAETPYTLELEKGVLVNSETAPHGYIYAGIATESAEINTAMTSSTPKKIFGEMLIKAFTGAPACLAVAMTVASPGVASAKLDVAAGKAVETAPIVFLQ